MSITINNVINSKIKSDHYQNYNTAKKLSCSIILNQVTNIIRFTAQKSSFPWEISIKNVNKSTVSCGFGHIYWRNPEEILPITFVEIKFGWRTSKI